MRERNKTENKRLTAITSKPGKENQNSRLERQKKCVNKKSCRNKKRCSAGFAIYRKNYSITFNHPSGA
ncbi:hypothetical protein DXA17_06090 [Ruminococcus sp. AM58-7XD]|nr:hypothetical protein DXA17_06090 [Ruminococcus sp. AM58-7XD]